jgi:hypothetical protein
MFKTLRAPAIIVAGAAFLAGCADNSTMLGGSGTNLTTASITEPPRTDPACASLVSQIDTLKKEGVADKVAQASVKKYKMTTADLTKADQLNRSNTEFQAKCSTVKGQPSAQTASIAPAPVAVAPVATASAPAAAKKIAPAVAKAAAQ